MLLADPSSNNSEYITGMDLLVDESACRVAPYWVVNATRAYLKEQENGGPSSPNRAPLALPKRCEAKTQDGTRCMLWSSGRIKDQGLCKMHLKNARRPADDVERARKRLMQTAPYAVDKLEELMDNAVAEQVRLKAATEILDRAGVRAGMDIDFGVELKDSRSPAQIIAERLARLKSGAQIIAGDIVDAEIESDTASADGSDPSSTSEQLSIVAADGSEIFTPQADVENAISDEELEELQ